MPIKKEIKEDPIKYAEYLENKKKKEKDQRKKYNDANKEKIKERNKKYHIGLVAKRAGIDKEDLQQN
jgi:hypothetical protein